MALIDTGRAVQIRAVDLNHAAELRPEVTSFEVPGVIVPSLDIGRHGVLEQRHEHAVWRWNMGALPAAQYQSGILIGPAEDHAIRIHAVQMYVHDPTVANPTPFNYALWTLDDSILAIQQVGRRWDANRVFDPGIQLGGAANPILAAGGWEFPEGLARTESQFIVQHLAAAADRITWYPQGGLVAVWPHRHQAPAIHGLAWYWQATPALNDVHEAVFHMIYSSVPAGMYPP